MNSITVTCSRCGNTFEGYQDEWFTSGFYNVEPGVYWHRFAREGETKLCDPCMWSDPEYLKVYPNDAEAQQWVKEQDGRES